MSTLSQFYPSGGSGGGGGGAAGVPYYYGVGGQVTANAVGPAPSLSPRLGAIWSIAGTVSVSAAGQVEATDGWLHLHLYNGSVGRLGITPGAKTVTLHDAVVGTLDVTKGAARIEGIYGSGVMGTVAVYAGHTASPVAKLTTISRDIVFASAGLAIQGAALNAASVNGILEGFLKYSGTEHVSGSAIDLSGGTSAGASALTPAGIAARDALVTAGWTVTLNS